MGVAAAAVLAAVLVGYLAIMRSEDDDPAGWFVALLVALVVAALVGGLGAGAEWKRTLLGVAALVATAVGVVAIFSVGLPILVAAALLWLAAFSRPSGPRSRP